MNVQSLLPVMLLAFVPASTANGDIPAFPGAEGFGVRTPGGRGGRVLFVENLNDDGPGSLRDAVRQQGPRIIMFRVGGTVRLKSHLRIQEPYVTIAGQTAPGGGILLRDAGFYISTHDVIVRFIRVRIGASTVEEYDTQDCLHIGDGPGVHDIIVDHCSFSWSIDEIASVVSGAHDVTLQWCIFAEALKAPLSLDKRRDHAYCLMLGNHPDRVSVHHNLLAHCEHRNPRIQGGTHDFVNNVVYNWGYFTAVFSRDPNTNFAGNYYKPGPESRLCLPLEEKPGEIGRVFVKGNRSPQRPSDALDDWAFTVGVAAEGHRVPKPFEVASVHTTNADTAYRHVLQYAGARKPLMDAVDERILTEVVNGGGRTIDRPEEVGGFPNMAYGIAAADDDQDGIADDWERRHADSDLEQYLNDLVSDCFPGERAAIQAVLTEAPAFDSGRLPARRHPFLFVTQEHVRTARRQMGEPAYREVVNRLNELAEAAHGLTLEPIDNAWWQEEKARPWHETYPIIYEKTCRQPVRMVHPAWNGALRYVITGDAGDAAAAKRILLHIADYTFEYEHYDVGMNYAVWGHMALSIYDILYNRFTPDERFKLDAFFTRMARAVLKNDIYWIESNIGGGINNHLAWHKMILGALGVFYDWPEAVAYALHGPRGLVPLLDDGLLDDGLWCESSLNYHFTAIVPMVYLANALRNTGWPEDLYTRQTPGRRNLNQAFTSMFGTLFPDGTIPPIGDTYGIIRKLGDEFTYRYAQQTYRDPHVAWLLGRSPATRPEALFIDTDSVTATAPPIGSRLYPEHGYAFLRSRTDGDYWDSDAWCAFLNFDKSGVHCHQDKLSLMLFACGKLLTPDVETVASAAHAFSAKVQRELNRSALSQNTVMVDYRDQRGTPHLLSLTEFRSAGDAQRVTAVDAIGALYNGVRQSRTVVLTPAGVLDVFQIAADRPHTLHWITHTLGTLDDLRASVTLEEIANPLPPPGNWLHAFREAATDEAFQIDCREDNVNLRITAAAQPGTKLIVCGYPKTDKPDTAMVPMTLIERNAAATVYAVFYQAGHGDLEDLRLEPTAKTPDSIVYRVVTASGSREYDIPALH